MYELLDKINSPADLKSLDIKELRTLCSEIRAYMVECCSRNPGHLASSLGAVELIVGMHYVYDAPQDRFVFDVGHQAYAHKIITGRREEFKTLRTEGGISGFPRMSESPYDAFGVGHSSTSISAALGLSEAARQLGRADKVIALIGDGALTGGLALEGLNNAGGSDTDLLVILNDNNQSIDRNTGGLHEHLMRLTTSRTYNRFKTRVWDSMGSTRSRAFFQRWIRSLKSWIVKKSGGDLFEALGLRYFGPIDGNDIEAVVHALRAMHELRGPRVLHCLTVKGKGYAPAEEDPTVWHAPGRFNPETGARISSPRTADRYQDVFGQVLLELAESDPRVVGVTPAMASGCGMNLLAEKMPGRFYDVGIEEEHAVTFSAGLAAGGLRPFCNIYSAFAQRSYDQIIHDVALQDLPVTLCFDRAGLVGEDGATHNGSFDLAAYRSIPTLVVSAPADERELKNLMHTALAQEHPFIIRYPRGMAEGREWRSAQPGIYEIGRAECLQEGDTLAILAIGPCVGQALAAAERFPGRVGVYNFRFLKPLDTQMLSEIAARYARILTMEDGALKGGLYGAVCESLAGMKGTPVIEGFGIGDEFVEHAPQAQQRKHYRLTAGEVEKYLEKVLQDSK